MLETFRVRNVWSRSYHTLPQRFTGKLCPLLSIAADRKKRNSQVQSTYSYIRGPVPYASLCLAYACACPPHLGRRPVKTRRVRGQERQNQRHPQVRLECRGL